MAYINRKQLIAENKRLRAQVAGKGKGTKKAKKVYFNVVDYPCTSPHTANWSSGKIVRHLNGVCGCNPDKAYKCYAHKRYDGMDYGNLGSKPNLAWTDLPA